MPFVAFAFHSHALCRNRPLVLMPHAEGKFQPLNRSTEFNFPFLSLLHSAPFVLIRNDCDVQMVLSLLLSLRMMLRYKHDRWKKEWEIEK